MATLFFIFSSSWVSSDLLSRSHLAFGGLMIAGDASNDCAFSVFFLLSRRSCAASCVCVCVCVHVCVCVCVCVYVSVCMFVCVFHFTLRSPSVAATGPTTVRDAAVTRFHLLPLADAHVLRNAALQALVTSKPHWTHYLHARSAAATSSTAVCTGSDHV